MFGHSKPIVLVSKCLGFARCRYNGEAIADDFVEKLNPYVQYVTVCPEVEIGFGVPREPIRVVSIRNQLHLVQPTTGKDVTKKLIAFSQHFLGSLGPVDGCILKSGSPSCGIKDVKIYPSVERSSARARGPGLFGRAVLETLAGYPVEDEGRLKNWRIREHFLTTIFTLARFRAASRYHMIGNLVAFQAQHKLLLMASNQNEMRVLGKIVANHENTPAIEVFARYREHLLQALSKPSRFTSNINVLVHALGYFKDKLNPKEKRHFLNSLKEYRDTKLPLSALLAIVNSWIARFHGCVSLRPRAPLGDTGLSERGDQNLESQIYFKPYPPGLLDTAD